MSLPNRSNRADATWAARSSATYQPGQRAARPRRVPALASLTASSLLAASVCFPMLAMTQSASAAVTVGTNISVFPDRDMVVAVGYELGEDLTIEVLRGDVVIGTTTGPAVDTPEGVGLEVNHGPLGSPLPGDCWTGFTPDIVGGDVIRVTSQGGVDTMTVQDVAFVGKPYLDPDGNVAVDGTGIQGESDFTVEFRRDKPDPRLRQGPFNPVWTSPTTWTATWRVPTTNISGLTPAQARTIALNEASWLAVADVATETTLAELGEPGGVGPGCTGSADPNNVVEPKPVNIASGDFNLTGTARAGVAEVDIKIGDLEPKAATLSTNTTGTKTWTLPVTKAEVETLLDGYVPITSTFVDAPTLDEAGAEVPGTAVPGADVLMLKDTSAPAAPTASPDGGTYSGTQAVSLDKGDNEDSSKIRYRLGNSAVLDPTVTSTEATGQISVSASQTLKARVVDLAGNLGAVGTFVYKIGTPPGAPSGVTAAEARGGVLVSWTAVGGATGYHVYRDGSTTPVNGATPLTGTSYTDGDLAEGVYAYTVRAVEVNGIESQPSNAATATLAAPAVPKGLKATPGDARTSIVWTANTEGDLQRYELVREGRATVTIAETQTGYTDTGLTNGTLYNYALVAVDDAGNTSAPSGQVQATPAPAPVTTRTVTVDAVADTMVRQGQPSLASGAATGLISDTQATTGNAATRDTSYVRFTVPALAAGESITGASLSLNVTDGTTNGPAIWRTATSWTESSATWSSGQPARSGTAAVGNYATMAAGRVSTPVSGVTSAGAVSFQLYADASDGLVFSSRETANRPKLTLTIRTP